MKRTLPPLTVLVAALLLAGCGQGAQSDSSTSPFASESEAKASSPAPKPATTAGTKVATPDEPTKNSDFLQLCLGVADPNWRQTCAAIASGDLTKCGDMVATEKVSKASWQAVCGPLVAAATKRAATCEQIESIAPGLDAATLSSRKADCYRLVAVASKSASLCGKSDSKAGCEYNVSMAKGTIILDTCTESICLFDYASRHRSTEACDKLGGFTSMGPTLKASCLAMLSGDGSGCDSIKPAGATEWGSCMTRALFGQAHPSAESFEFSACGKDLTCLSLAIEAFAFYLADQ